MTEWKMSMAFWQHHRLKDSHCHYDIECSEPYKGFRPIRFKVGRGSATELPFREMPPSTLPRKTYSRIPCAGMLELADMSSKRDGMPKADLEIGPERDQMTWTLRVSLGMHGLKGNCWPCALGTTAFLSSSLGSICSLSKASWSPILTLLYSARVLLLSIDTLLCCST